MMKLVSEYYEVIKELLIALLLKQGLKSYNHECLISFFKKEYLINNKFEFRHTLNLLNELIMCVNC